MAYSPEDRERIMCAVLARMEGGQSLRQAAKAEGVAAASILNWCDSDPQGSEQYMRARAALIDWRLEEMEQIADDNSRDVSVDDKGHESTNHDVIARARLRIDQRRWELTKLMPKRFGDSIKAQVTGEDGGPVQMVTEIVRKVVRSDAAQPDNRDG